MLSIGDIVSVREGTEKTLTEAEDIYYIKKFEKKKGKIIEIAETSAGFDNISVEFDNGQIGIFYSDELKKIA